MIDFLQGLAHKKLANKTKYPCKYITTREKTAEMEESFYSHNMAYYISYHKYDLGKKTGQTQRKFGKLVKNVFLFIKFNKKFLCGIVMLYHSLYAV